MYQTSVETLTINNKRTLDTKKGPGFLTPGPFFVLNLRQSLERNIRNRSRGFCYICG